MNEINFEEIKKIVDSFPQLPKRERSMIEIIGFPNHENVNSSFLAFYFDEKEEHQLQRLFLNALLNLIGLDTEDYQGDFIVFREFSTNKGNRIDILIKGDDWAIIIENKIYHWLSNDLSDYWDSIKVDNKNKIGIILSLKKEHENYHENFKNITHKELLNEVKNNLGFAISNISQKHLLHLKDFILNVDNYYYYQNNSHLMSTKLIQYQKNIAIIEQIEQLKKDVKSHIIDTFNNVFNKINFYTSSKSSYYKHYTSEDYEGLRFYYNFELLSRNTLLLTIEFYGDFTKYIDIVKNNEKYKQEVELLDLIKFHEKCEDEQGDYSHVLFIEIDNFLSENDDLEDKINSIIIEKIGNRILPLIKRIIENQ